MWSPPWIPLTPVFVLFPQTLPILRHIFSIRLFIVTYNALCFPIIYNIKNTEMKLQKSIGNKTKHIKSGTRMCTRMEYETLYTIKNNCSSCLNIVNSKLTFAFGQ